MRNDILHVRSTLFTRSRYRAAERCQCKSFHYRAVTRGRWTTPWFGQECHLFGFETGIRCSPCRSHQTRVRAWPRIRPAAIQSGETRLRTTEGAPMLQLRPNCECCNRDLSGDSDAAYICSFECTFCTRCAIETLDGTCPNCAGELVRRPRRTPEKLLQHPASVERIFKPEGCVT